MKGFMINITQKIEYIVDRIPWIYKLFKSYYDKVLENEIKLADINESDRILCIGGGPCPCTAIELHRRTGANVCVIDNDKDVIQTAINNIKRFKLSDSVKVKYQDASQVEVNDFSIVHIALQVCPKDQVFKRIVNDAAEGTKVLVRISNKKVPNLYSSFNTEHIDIYKKIYHKKRNIDYTLLHIATGGSNEEVLETASSVTASSLAN